MVRIVLFFLIAGTLSLSASEFNIAKLQILSTIKPIHLIVIELAGDRAEAHQLIPDNASPHNYNYKPSDISKIKDAALIFRIDEHLESIISPALERYSQDQKLVSLADADGIHLLSLNGEHGHKHSEGENSDLHIWTSPKNSIAMARIISKYLIKHDAGNESAYVANLNQFVTRVQVRSQQIENELQSFKNTEYVVFNNSWNYFRHSFGLKDPIVINRQEGQVGNIRSIMNIRKKITANKISCVFTDPSINSARINTIIEDQTVNTVQIDVLASDIRAKQGAYFKWLNSMSVSIKECLKGSD